MRLISDVMQSILPPGMRAPTRPARHSWAILALGAVLLPLTGCKAPGTSQSPAADLDDIVAIESELAVNAERLEAQGVRIARATEAKAEPAGDTIASEDADDTEHAGAPAPPAESAPEPAVAPEPEPEPEPAVEEADEDYAPASAPSEREYTVGLSRSSRKSEKKKSRRERTRCERICDLAEATCTLSDRICGLADEHVDDVRYEDACDRAQSQCEAASEACSACED